MAGTTVWQRVGIFGLLGALSFVTALSAGLDGDLPTTGFFALLALVCLLVGARQRRERAKTAINRSPRQLGDALHARVRFWSILTAALIILLALSVLGVLAGELVAIFAGGIGALGSVIMAVVTHRQASQAEAVTDKLLQGEKFLATVQVAVLDNGKGPKVGILAATNRALLIMTSSVGLRRIDYSNLDRFEPAERRGDRLILEGQGVALTLSGLDREKLKVLISLVRNAVLTSKGLD